MLGKCAAERFAAYFGIARTKPEPGSAAFFMLSVIAVTASFHGFFAHRVVDRLVRDNLDLPVHL